MVWRAGDRAGAPDARLMGCCNKKHVGEPIGRLRFYGGLAMLAGVQAGTLGALYVVAVPLPRYRKVLPFYLEYARQTLDSVRQKERICVASRSGEAACANEQEGLNTRP